MSNLIGVVGGDVYNFADNVGVVLLRDHIARHKAVQFEGSEAHRSILEQAADFHLPRIYDLTITNGRHSVYPMTMDRLMHDPALLQMRVYYVVKQDDGKVVVYIGPANRNDLYPLNTEAFSGPGNPPCMNTIIAAIKHAEFKLPKQQCLELTVDDLCPEDVLYFGFFSSNGYIAPVNSKGNVPFGVATTAPEQSIPVMDRMGQHVDLNQPAVGAGTVNHSEIVEQLDLWTKDVEATGKVLERVMITNVQLHGELLAMRDRVVRSLNLCKVHSEPDKLLPELRNIIGDYKVLLKQYLTNARNVFKDVLNQQLVQIRILIRKTLERDDCTRDVQMAMVQQHKSVCCGIQSVILGLTDEHWIEHAEYEMELTLLGYYTQQATATPIKAHNS